jgi:hypothetical protein
MQAKAKSAPVKLLSHKHLGLGIFPPESRHQGAPALGINL